MGAGFENLEYNRAVEGPRVHELQGWLASVLTVDLLEASLYVPAPPATPAYSLGSFYVGSDRPCSAEPGFGGVGLARHMWPAAGVERQDALSRDQHP